MIHTLTIKFVETHTPKDDEETIRYQESIQRVLDGIENWAREHADLFLGKSVVVHIRPGENAFYYPGPLFGFKDWSQLDEFNEYKAKLAGWPDHQIEAAYEALRRRKGGL